jgi:hypothetical protein
VSVGETTDPSAANVVVDTATTSAAGGYANGVLGCYTTAGEITLIQGWNWYTGSDPTQIGASQYDFQTTVTHELMPWGWARAATRSRPCTARWRPGRPSAP